MFEQFYFSSNNYNEPVKAFQTVLGAFLNFAEPRSTFSKSHRTLVNSTECVWASEKRTVPRPLSANLTALFFLEPVDPSQNRQNPC